MIDAHQHCWQIGRNDCIWPTRAEAAIHRDVLPDDWLAVARPLGVSASLLVQSQESARDTEWLLRLAAQHDHILGVVGWANLKTGPIPASPWLKGLRPMVQNRPSAWFDDPALDKCLGAMARRGLVLDGLVRTKHIPALRRLALRYPGLQIVIDHGAKPDIAHGWLGEWKAVMAPIAALPNVHCKLSGLLTEAAAGQQCEVARTAEWLFATFGADRLIWGSDWPVVDLAANYGAWLALAKSAIPGEAHDAVFGGNARRVYSL